MRLKMRRNNDRRSFTRKSGFRSKHIRYIICVEGRATEKAYFNMFKAENTHIEVKVIDNKSKSHPSHVLNKLKSYLEENEISISRYDKAWMVVDRDVGDRSKEQLDQVYDKCILNKYNFSLSNPCFELWLLLHFENPAAKDADTSTKCKNRLKTYLPNYEKSHVEVLKMKPYISNAIRNAESKNISSSDPWPQNVGSTVYKLVTELVE